MSSIQPNADVPAMTSMQSRFFAERSRAASLQSPSADSATAASADRWKTTAAPGDRWTPAGWKDAPNAGAPNCTPGYGSDDTLTPGTAQGGFAGVIKGLIAQLDALLGQYGETSAEGAQTQNVGNATFASTGDPHLSEQGNALDAAGNSTAIDRRFDSMTSHDNLLSSQDFAGGYRLSTSVGAANAKGVNVNAAATVHLNNDRDDITLRNDGSMSITSDGTAVSLGDGESTTLAGGERVARGSDGSLTVVEENAVGGSVSTTLAAHGGGVDATATVAHATVGGDIANNTVNAAPSSAAFGAPFANAYANDNALVAQTSEFA